MTVRQVHITPADELCPICGLDNYGRHGHLVTGTPPDELTPVWPDERPIRNAELQFVLENPDEAVEVTYVP